MDCVQLWLCTTVYEEQNSNPNNNLKTRFQLQNGLVRNTVTGVLVSHSPRRQRRLSSS
jgi:hypothetical protein